MKIKNSENSVKIYQDEAVLAWVKRSVQLERLLPKANKASSMPSSLVTLAIPLSEDRPCSNGSLSSKLSRLERYLQVKNP